jgi:transcriptional regulator with XRE-family HTH domain
MAKSSHQAKQLGSALAALRWRSGKTQEEIEHESGITQSTISRYESGQKGLGPEILQRLLATLGQDEPALQATLQWLEATAGTARQDPQNRAWQKASVETGQKMTDLLRRLADLWVDLEAPPELRAEPKTVPEDDLDHARALRRRLQRHPHEHWPHLFQWAPDFRYWRLCELLCDESLELAAEEPRQALIIAQGAQQLARHLPYEQRKC